MWWITCCCRVDARNGGVAVANPPCEGLLRGGSGRARDCLFDRPEHALPVLALHLDADRVAEAHELGRRLAVLDGFDRALLGDAAVALGPVGLALGVGHA